MAVGNLFPLITCAQVQQEWKGVFSDVDLPSSQNNSTNVVSLPNDSLWHAGLYYYSPGIVKELNKHFFFIQRRNKHDEQIRLQYEGRSFNQYAEHLLVAGFGKKYSDGVVVGMNVKYQSQKYSNDYYVKSSLLIEPECLLQLTTSFVAYSRISLPVINSKNRISEINLAIRYNASAHVYFTADASIISNANSSCFIGMSYLPSEKLKFQASFDLLNTNAVWQVQMDKNKMGIHMGSRYKSLLGFSPFIGLTTQF